MECLGPYPNVVGRRPMDDFPIFGHACLGIDLDLS